MKVLKIITSLILLIVVLIPLLINVAVYNNAAVTLYWPVPGHTRISQYLHKNAIDISDSSIYGADVIAAMSGTVTHVFTCTENHYPNLSSCNGFGTGVVIAGDDGRTYQYAHMMGYSIPSNVYVGAYVNKGQKIGRVGNTGNSSATHLHFGISPTNRYWDPSTKCPSTENYDYSGVSSTVTKLTISGVNYPMNKKSGDSFEVFGVISSPNLLVYGEAIVYDANGNFVFGIGTYNYLRVFNFNEYDSQMTFSSLPDGEYTYVVRARDSKGYTASISKNFSVGGYSSTTSATEGTIEGKHDCDGMNSWDSGKVYVLPGCLQNGVRTYTCTECKATKTENIPAVGHSWDSGKIQSEANCLQNGIKVYTCNNCGEIRQETVPSMGGHSWSSWITAKEPTIYEEGCENRICNQCGLYESRTLPKLENPNPFYDVPNAQWYTDGILWCYDRGYMSGVSENYFDRKGNTTRAMFVTILAGIDGADESYSTMSFTDVKSGRWYSNSIEWAYRNGYASGIGGNLFGYNDPVTREQLALFLYTYSQKKGYNVYTSVGLSGYSDHSSIHYWALNAMEWAVSKGLISGTSTTTLSPRNNATRAEIALIIRNYVETVANISTVN